MKAMLERNAIFSVADKMWFYGVVTTVSINTEISNSYLYLGYRRLTATDKRSMCQLRKLSNDGTFAHAQVVTLHFIISTHKFWSTVLYSQQGNDSYQNRFVREDRNDVLV